MGLNLTLKLDWCDLTLKLDWWFYWNDLTEDSQIRSSRTHTMWKWTMTKWMTSGAQRLKANLNRSFGARKNRKGAAAATKDKSYESVIASARVGDGRRNQGKRDWLVSSGLNVEVSYSNGGVFMVLCFFHWLESPSWACCCCYCFCRLLIVIIFHAFIRCYVSQPLWSE